ncbi:MAG: alpha/beta hydrolase [Pseudomonadota bacterium]
MTIMTTLKTATATSHIVRTRLGNLYVSETGGGSETLVLWPSIFTDHHIYENLVRELGQQYRFLLIDGPGHGGSEGPGAEFTMGECAGAMADILDYFKLENAIVGGTSWGGLTAAELALTMPERVRAVLLLNTPMEINGGSPGLSARFIAFGARWMLSTDMFRNGIAKSFFSKGVLDGNPAYSASFHEMLKAADAKALAAAVRSVILRGSPLKDRMDDLTAPTLVIAGKEDEMYPVEAQIEAALRAPRGWIKTVGGKHISAIERPVEVADAVEDFLKKELAA